MKRGAPAGGGLSAPRAAGRQDSPRVVLSDVPLIGENAMSDRIASIRKAVVDGKHAEIETMVQRAIDDKTDLDILINEALIVLRPPQRACCCWNTPNTRECSSRSAADC